VSVEILPLRLRSGLRLKHSSVRSEMTQSKHPPPATAPSNRGEAPHPAAVPIFLSSGAAPVLSEAEGGHPLPGVTPTPSIHR